MARLEIVLVLFCALQLELCYGNRISRSSDNDEQMSKEFKLSIDQYEKLNLIVEEYKDIEEHYLFFNMIMIAKLCPIIAPEEKYSRSINLVVLSPAHLEKFEQMYHVAHALPRSEKIAYSKGVCDFMNQSIITENIPSNEIISVEQYREFTAIAKKANVEDLSGKNTQNSRLASDRELCQVLNSANNIATSAPETPAELSTEQLVDYERLRNETENLSQIRWHSQFRKVCDFLNETVSPQDQAEKLGISVELYDKLVVVRKLYTDKTDAGQLEIAEHYCEILNDAGISGISLTYQGRFLQLNSDNLRQFNRLWTKANKAPSSERTSLIDVCNFLNIGGRSANVSE